MPRGQACTVDLATSKGAIKLRPEAASCPWRLRVVPSWAPKGAQRFLQLVADKYYTDLAIYRAVLPLHLSAMTLTGARLPSTVRRGGG